MAGESPDRSKQNESSAETTSGSRAPVPDPRLAVAREAVTAASRVDTATAVFSTKSVTGSARSAESAEPADAAEPEGSDGSASGSSRGSDGSAEPERPAEGGAQGAGGGDARLRNAVAAWVATADEKAPEGASADEGAGGGTDDADADDPGADAEVSSETEADAEAEVEAEAGSESQASQDVQDVQDVSEADAEAPSSGADSGPDDVAPDIATPDADSGTAEKDSEADAEREPGSGSTDAVTSQPKAETAADADADVEADEAPGAAGASESEPKDAAPKDAAPADAPAKATASDADADADAEVGDETPDAAAAAAAGAGTLAVDAAEDEAPDTDSDSAADTASGADPDPGAGKDSGVAKDSAAASDVGGAKDSAAASDSDAVEDKPEPRVDQATAVFKRPPSVDQPTTMLKLGGATSATGDGKTGERSASEADSGAGAKAGTGPDAGAGKVAEPGRATGTGKDGAAAAGGKAAAEAEAERTSKFVALKPLDEPAPPKAKPAASPSVPPAAETTAIPQVGPERTTQQPLPPRPPLDLLAELTNTPAPRQTPVRTLVRRVKIWTPFVLLLAVVFAVVQAVRPLPAPTLALTADKSYAFEGNKVALPWPEEGQGWMDVNGIGTVDTFGEQKPVAIGSVAKAMTAYVILKEHPLKPGEDGEKIPVDAKAETEGGFDKDGESTLNTVKEGDTLTEKDALAAIMIPSANNIARLLARWDSNGSEEAFVKKMNDAAKDLGMTNTTYTDPSGLKETTVSTAEDQVKLGNELVDIQALVDITKLPSWVDPSGKKWDNYNRLVPYNNAIGIKTGSTTKAGGNLLFAATQEVGGENVIVVGAILGQHTPPIIDTVNAVSKTAMIAAQEALTSRKILKKGDVVGYVDDGLGGRTPVVATKDVSAVGWAGQTVKLKLSEDGTAIPHEAKAGTKVGSLSVGDGTTGDAVDVPVALQSDLTEPGYGAKLTRVS
ncbi:D-alanyl-D-alanine carboxypeptidase [Streptomyces sp. BV286]|uniref:D-alanyl-D-alanine carboxypeptidase n=1 Tax=Streptomyces sp. BV286 TaxID=2849672 RepID=UPI0027E444C9|nr:D-alanyl-D-alanine carboxypeptidase [Streptomyces sp. BV286]